MLCSQVQKDQNNSELPAIPILEYTCKITAFSVILKCILGINCSSPDICCMTECWHLFVLSTPHSLAVSIIVHQSVLLGCTSISVALPCTEAPWKCGFVCSPDSPFSSSDFQQTLPYFLWSHLYVFFENKILLSNKVILYSILWCLLFIYYMPVTLIVIHFLFSETPLSQLLHLSDPFFCPRLDPCLSPMI